MAVDKVIVSNFSALGAKYGSAQLPKIKSAINTLIAADKKRGLTTVVVGIDVAGDMSKLKGQPVKQADDERAVKEAIDAIDAALTPDYILLLGAPDVIPHQSLINPVYSPGGDDDIDIPSDLPYACDAPYSRDGYRFVGPTRVIGRLPDVYGAAKPAFLFKLLRTAASYKPLTRDDYMAAHFGLSAEIWRGSTALSLSNLFGSGAAMHTTPAEGPQWTPEQLQPRAHFINCHGAQIDPNYYGQPASGASGFPTAHSAAWLPKKIAPGTVASAECCYGAQLYDPQLSQGQGGIASTYLEQGAYGFFGSTTIAYGPSEGNGSADLICQYFLQGVFGSASLGRSTLEAWQRFAQQYTHLDPINLKTLAQFYLLGDPSIQPVASAPHALNQTSAFKSAFKGQAMGAGTRSLRRERLKRVGAALQRDLPRLRKSKEQPPAPVAASLSKAARESGLKQAVEYNFEVVKKDRAAPQRTVHVLTQKTGTETDNIKHVLALLATVEEGQLIHLRRLHSR